MLLCIGLSQKLPIKYPDICSNEKVIILNGQFKIRTLLLNTKQSKPAFCYKNEKMQKLSKKKKCEDVTLMTITKDGDEGLGGMDG